jgi:hypothetical protein
MDKEYVICTDIGGRSFVHTIAHDVVGKIDKVIWCANIDKARRFSDLGEIAQYFSAIPARFEAYEGNPEELRWNFPKL